MSEQQKYIASDTFTEDEFTQGVYSADLKKWFIPTEYDCIDYGDRIIACEVSGKCYERYFDYDGKELSFEDYDSVSEEDGNLRIHKDGNPDIRFLLRLFYKQKYADCLQTI